MEEYIKREDVLDAVLFALVGTGVQSKAIYAIRGVETADVVPRSEVEKFIQEIDQIQKDKAEVTFLKEQLISKAKQEVAREIFAELETLKQQWASGEVVPYRFIAELKKKYTGEQ